jgi:hypothetical protein
LLAAGCDLGRVGGLRFAVNSMEPRNAIADFDPAS